MIIFFDKVKRKVKRKVNSIRHLHFDKFVFIHIGKTGGTSVEKILNIPHEHKIALDKMQEIGIDKWNSKLKFAIVRNPWDKVVSHYHYRVKTNQTQLRDKPIPFKEWVKLTYGEQVPFYFNHPEMFIPQLDWITDKEGNIIVDEVIRFENLEQEFHDVMKKLSLNLYLPHVNSTKRGSYRDYYDEETAEIVRSWFMRDIEYFKYTY